MQTIDAVKLAYNAILDKMGFNIVAIDIKDISILAEFFIIASANNPNQLRAIMDEVQKKLSEAGIKQRHVEGLQSLRWVLLDFGHIVVHLFLPEERENYRLEKLWADGKTLVLEDL